MINSGKKHGMEIPTIRKKRHDRMHERRKMCIETKHRVHCSILHDDVFMVVFLALQWIFFFGGVICYNIVT